MNCRKRALSRPLVFGIGIENSDLNFSTHQTTSVFIHRNLLGLLKGNGLYFRGRAWESISRDEKHILVVRLENSLRSNRNVGTGSEATATWLPGRNKPDGHSTLYI